MKSRLKCLPQALKTDFMKLIFKLPPTAITKMLLAK